MSTTPYSPQAPAQREGEPPGLNKEMLFRSKNKPHKWASP